MAFPAHPQYEGRRRSMVSVPFGAFNINVEDLRFLGFQHVPDLVDIRYVVEFHMQRNIPQSPLERSLRLRP